MAAAETCDKNTDESFAHFISETVARRCSVRKGVLRNFTKFTGKHLRQDPFVNKVTSASASNFIKKETLAQVFSREFCEISKDTFFTEHLQWLLLSFEC